MYCPRYKAVLLGVMSDGALLSRARCKMWDCEYCAEINKRIWQARILKHIHSEDTPENWSFITITSSSKKRTPLATLTNLTGGWTKLIQRIRRKFGNPHYVRIFQPHKDKAIHMHALISVHWDDIKSAKTPQGREYNYSVWLRRACRETGLGWAGSAENIKAGAAGAAAYATRYMTREVAEIAKIKPKTRVIQASQDFADTKLKKTGNWSLIDKLTYHEFRLIINQSQTLTDLATGKQVTSDDYLELDYYPPDDL